MLAYATVGLSGLITFRPIYDAEAMGIDADGNPTWSAATSKPDVPD